MGVCEIPVVSSVCHAAGKVASSVVSAPFEWVAEGVGAAAGWMFKGVWQLFTSTTLVNLTEPNYLKVYDVLFGVAVFLMLLFFCLQLITGLVRRDPGALRRAAIGLGTSVLGSFLVVSLTGLALEIVDELCVGVIQASGNTLEEMGGKIAALGAGIGAISLAAPGAGAVIVIFLGCLAITGAAMVWGSLLVRKALLLVAVVLAPVALAGQSWDMARGWFGKWAGFVIALVVSKLVVVVIFLVAINQMNAPIDLGLSSIANPVAGIVLMLVAAFAPYIAYKFISFIGIDHYHAMSMESDAKQAVKGLPAAATSPLASARKILGGGGKDGGDAGGRDGGFPGGLGGGFDGGDAGGSGPGGGMPGGRGGGVPGPSSNGGGRNGGDRVPGGRPRPSGAVGAAAEGRVSGSAARAGAAGGAMGLGGIAGAQPIGTAAKAAPAAARGVVGSAEQHAQAAHDAAAGLAAAAAHDPGRAPAGAAASSPPSSPSPPVPPSSPSPGTEPPAQGS